jgi:hypothetical protein
MLSSEEKNRIRAEEVFRQEVRRELSTKKDGKLLTFLNSALGIWLLSTIVVGLLSWSYTVWRDSRASASQTAETIRRLDAEIASRIHFLQSYLPSVQKREDFWTALWMIEQPRDAHLTLTVFPEYNSRGLTSLLWELRTLTPELQKPPINAAIAGAQRLSRERVSRLASLQGNESNGDVLDSERKLVLGVLHTYFSEHRWVTFEEGPARQELRDIVKDGWSP